MKIELNIKKELTNEEVEDILCTALEGGIGYWACLRNDLPTWQAAKEECCKIYGKEHTFYSTVVMYLLENDKSVVFEDAEADEDEDPDIWELTKDKFIHGCELYELKYGSISKALDDGGFDANDADMIIQLALFNEVVFG